MKKSKILFSAYAALALTACSSGGDNNTTAEGNEKAPTDIETAVNDGRIAARALINIDPTDTLAVQTALIDARSRQSEYVTAGKKDAAEAFDTAFIHTLRAVSPKVATEIEKMTK